MLSSKIKIGTRGSKLALYQAEETKKAIQCMYPKVQVEIVVIKTKGDKILDTALSKIGDKGIFTKELENALLEGKIDMAVHSLKDIPTQLAENLKLACVLDRGTVNDALVSINGKRFCELNKSDVIATSSLRRKATVLHHFPDAKVIDIRGNIQTRLQKMHDGHCTAMILAATGLERLNLKEHISEIISVQEMIPAIGQGAIGIETVADNEELNKITAQINHEFTWNTVMAERSFLKEIEGGCQVPAGCYSKVHGENLILVGFVASEDGDRYIQHEVKGGISDNIQLGKNLADKILHDGGYKIMQEIRTPQ